MDTKRIIRPSTGLPSNPPPKVQTWIAMLARLGLFTTLSLALSVLTSNTLARPSGTGSLDRRWDFPSEIDVLSVTLQELQQFLSNGTVTSVQLVQRYLVSHVQGIRTGRADVNDRIILVITIMPVWNYVR
jgi:hypothetical protein